METVDDEAVFFTFKRYLEEMENNHADLLRYTTSQSLDRYGKSVYQSLSMSYSALPQLTREFLHLCGYFHRSNIPVLMFESAVDGKFRQADGVDIMEHNSTAVENKLAAMLQVPSGSTTIHLHKILFSLKMFSLVVTSMTPDSVMLNYHALVNTWSRDILPTADKRLYSSMAIQVISTSSNGKYYLVHASLLPHMQDIMRRRTDLHPNDMTVFAKRFIEGGMGAEAEALYRKVYDFCAREYGRNDDTTLTVLGNIACCFTKQGRFGEAADLEQEVLARRRSDNSGNDTANLSAEINLASTYLDQERWAEAEAMLSKLLVIAKEKFGEADKHTLYTMNNLSVALFRQDRYQEAVEIQENVYAIRKRAFGKEHPDTLDAMANLAVSYAASNRLEDAEKLQEEVVGIKTRIKGKDHPDTLVVVNNLAETYRRRDKLGDAVELGERALEGFVEVLGKNHPQSLQSMRVVAKIYFQMERTGDGVRIQEELRHLEGGDGGKYSKELTDALRDLGFV
jgi:tetratricopeptide (TPR) repeat protein